MADLSKPQSEEFQTIPALFAEKAREKLEGEPEQAMYAVISRKPGDYEWAGAKLRPTGFPLAPSPVGQRLVASKLNCVTLVSGVLAWSVMLSSTAAHGEGVMSDHAYDTISSSFVILIFTIVVALGCRNFFSAKHKVRKVWLLPHVTGSRQFRFQPETLRGEEARLARHSAAALWNLHAGRGSRTWRSENLAQWRNQLDLRKEFPDTIRAAGTLQALRESLGDFPDHLDESTQSEWKADYLVYKSGLAALRERVEQQVALQMAAAEIDRHRPTSADDRRSLADRVIAELPAHEQAVEAIAEINSQSADLLGILAIQGPTIELPTSSPDDGQPKHQSFSIGQPGKVENSSKTG